MSDLGKSSLLVFFLFLLILAAAASSSSRAEAGAVTGSQAQDTWLSLNSLNETLSPLRPELEPGLTLAACPRSPEYKEINGKCIKINPPRKAVQCKSGYYFDHASGMCKPSGGPVPHKAPGVRG